MKTILRYYGGKQRLAKWIISKFPINYHKLSYCEPFAGGLAVLFEKKVSPIEVISDIDENLFNFFKILREEPLKLHELLKNTDYNRNTHFYAKKIREKKIKTCDITRAWAYFFEIYSSVNSCFGGGFKLAYKQGHNPPKTFQSKLNIIKEASERLKYVQIENRSANTIIDRLKNFEDYLFYLDPPYPNTKQGHYSGFSLNDFNDLLHQLKDVKFKFALSFYKKEGMKLNLIKNAQILQKNVTISSTNSNKNVNSKRVECLLLNYNNHNEQKSFF